jgi:hypothetical protein
MSSLSSMSKLMAHLAETTNSIVGFQHAPADATDWPDLRGPASTAKTLGPLAARPDCLDENGATVIHGKWLHDTDNEFGGWARRRKGEFVGAPQKLLVPAVLFGLTYLVRHGG